MEQAVENSGSACSGPSPETSRMFLERESKAWPDNDLLRPFNCVPQEVGIARTPWQWRTSVLAVPGRCVPRKVALLALTGKERRKGELKHDAPERELVQYDISSLDLSGCDLSGDAPIGFGRGWKVPRLELTRLSLCYTSLCENDLVGLLACIPANLINLDISGNTFGLCGAQRASSQAKQQLLQLEKLALGHCDLGDDGCVEICRVLCQSKHLTHLALNGNGLTDAGCMAIGDTLLRSRVAVLESDFDATLEPQDRQMINETLEAVARKSVPDSISTTENDLQEEQATLLSWVFNKNSVVCPPLRVLNIADNCISDAQVFADFLQACEHRMSLSLLAFQGNEVFDEVFHHSEIVQGLELIASQAGCLQRQVRLAAALLRDRHITCALGCGAIDVRCSPPRALELHLQLLCKASPVPCTRCSLIVSASKMSNHLAKECPDHPLECALGCGFSITRRSVEAESQKAANIDIRKPVIGVENNALVEQHNKSSRASTQDNECEQTKDHAMLAVRLHERFECPRRVAPCNWGCGEILHASEVEEHQRDACAERQVTCTFLIKDKENNEHDELIPCNTNMPQKELEAHLRQHRAAYHDLLIQASGMEILRDPPGAESQVARGLLGQLEKLCASVSLSISDRSKRRADERASRESESRELKAAMDRASAEQKAETLERAKAAVDVWRELVPRTCCNLGCDLKIFERDSAMHSQSCPHRIIRCELGCETTELKAKDKDIHLEFECPERWVECHQEKCEAFRMRAKERAKHVIEFHTVLQL